MNAGIPGREQKDVVREIQIVSADGKSEQTLPAEELDFAYRDLKGLPEGAVIVSGLFEIQTSTREAVQAEVRRLLERRSDTQPLDIPSCGSVFETRRATMRVDSSRPLGSRGNGSEALKSRASTPISLPTGATPQPRTF